MLVFQDLPEVEVWLRELALDAETTKGLASSTADWNSILDDMLEHHDNAPFGSIAVTTPHLAPGTTLMK